MTADIFDQYSVKVTKEQANIILKLLSDIDIADKSIADIFELNRLTIQLEEITKEASL